MRIVADTNVLFSYFNIRSGTYKLIVGKRLNIVSPEYAKKEMLKYKTVIMKKASITSTEFFHRMEKLSENVSFLPIKYYSSYTHKASKLLDDCDDVDFLALSMKLRLPLWTNNAGFKQQKEIIIFSTSDLIEFPEWTSPVNSLP